MTKVLVTGATGFLAAHVIPALLDGGHHVIGVGNSRLTNDHIEKSPALEYINKSDLERVLLEEEVDAIVHLATDYGRTSAAAVAETNFLWPRKILELVADSNKRITFLNIDTFFAKPGLDHSYLSEYVTNKRKFQAAGEDFARKEKNLSFITARLEHVYGQYDSSTKFLPWLIGKMKSNDNHIDLTDGLQKRDFVFAPDVAQVLTYLLKEELYGTNSCKSVEVGTGRPMALREFIEKVAELSGYDKRRLRFGALERRPDEIMYSVADVTSLKKYYKTSFTDLEVALAKTIDAY